MSPQGLQAQAVLQKIANHDRRRDTPTLSLLKHLKRQASRYLEAGALPENERHYFSQKFGSFGI